MIEKDSYGNYKNYFSFPVLDSFPTPPKGSDLMVTGDVLTGFIRIGEDVEVVKPDRVFKVKLTAITRIGGNS